MQRRLSGCSVIKFALLFGLLPSLSQARQWESLFNGHDISGWEVVGDGYWSAPGGGLLIGQCDLRKPCQHQSWLYTKADFGEFDLKLDYWLRRGGNSGVSVWDTSRAQGAIVAGGKTPSHVGYEINIDNDALKEFDVTGSIYLIEAAKSGPQHDDSWNTMIIEARKDRIRVRVNGVVVAEHAVVPGRPKRGPIGLQLHDAKDVVLFRSIQLRRMGP
jgi:hypothetical protein